MILRRTVEGADGVYRIFETRPGVFHVLDGGGRTVDEFDVVDTKTDKGTMMRAFRRGPLAPGAPNLAASFVRDLNVARMRD